MADEALTTGIKSKRLDNIHAQRLLTLGAERRAGSKVRTAAAARRSGSASDFEGTSANPGCARAAADWAVHTSRVVGFFFAWRVHGVERQNSRPQRPACCSRKANKQSTARTAGVLRLTPSTPRRPPRPPCRPTRHRPPRSPSRGPRDPHAPRRTHPPPCPRRRTSARTHASST